LPLPSIYYDHGGYWVVFRKDMYYPEHLKNLGLNERQVKAVLYVKEKGKITNGEYQEINDVSKRTATSDLSELVQKYEILKNTGIGAGSYYKIIGQ
jgi:ATP-dependent DNA helicase RecG